MDRFSKLRLYPWVALLGGAIGFALQYWQYSLIDAQGFWPKNHISGILSVLLFAIVVAVCWFGVQNLAPEKEYEKLFPASKIAAAGGFLAALGIGCTVFAASAVGSLRYVMLAFGLLSTGALVMAGYDRLYGKRTNSLLHSVVVIYLIFYTMTACRIWSADPQWPGYLFDFFAVIFLLMACYQRAVLDEQVGSSRMYVFYSNVALFCCCLALPGENWLFYLAAGIWMATDYCTPSPCGKYAHNGKRKMYLPQPVLQCMQTLEQAGFEAYAVGGCVRDSLLWLIPHDYDLCTNAKPQEIADLFADHTLVRAGEKHGTIGVVVEKDVIEITTFRTEGSYQDNRHPDWVEFVSTIEEDLARRDFTVNAMAYNPSRGYVDPYGGQADLRHRILRTVGDPEERFTEDALRILRGVRFAVRFGLRAEEKTLAAMNALAPTMDKLSKERVYEELCKLLPVITAEDLCAYQTVLAQVVPPLAKCIGFDQHTPHHSYDVYTHTAKVVAAMPRNLVLRWAALLHDCGKPDTFLLDENGKGHFHGHAKVSAEQAEKLLFALKAPTALRERVVFLIDQHMKLLTADKRRIRRFIGKYGKQAFFELLILQQGDFNGKGTEKETERFQSILAVVEEVLEENACFTVKDLCINGDDLKTLGFKPGPRMGKCLTHLLELVQDEKVSNERQALLVKAKEFLSKKA